VLAATHRRVEGVIRHLGTPVVNDRPAARSEKVIHQALGSGAGVDFVGCRDLSSMGGISGKGCTGVPWNVQYQLPSHR
jgi:hypothetical protein